MSTKSKKFHVQFKGNVQIADQEITEETVIKPLEKLLAKKHWKKVILRQESDGFYVRKYVGIILLKKKYFKCNLIKYVSVLESDSKCLTVIDSSISGMLRLSWIRFENPVELMEIRKLIEPLQNSDPIANEDDGYFNAEDPVDISFDDIRDGEANVNVDVVDSRRRGHSGSPIYDDTDFVYPFQDAEFNRRRASEEGPEDVCVVVDLTDEYAVNLLYAADTEVANSLPVEESENEHYTDDISFDSLPIDTASSFIKPRLHSQYSLPNLYGDFNFDIVEHKLFCRTARMDNISQSNLENLCQNIESDIQDTDIPSTIGPGSTFMYSKKISVSDSVIYAECESDDEVF